MLDAFAIAVSISFLFLFFIITNVFDECVSVAPVAVAIVRGIAIVFDEGVPAAAFPDEPCRLLAWFARVGRRGREVRVDDASP